MIVSYADSDGSPCVSASRMPSVMNLTSVRSETWSVKRTWKPTSSPSGVESSSATRRATERAAMRRGCVQPIIPATPRPAARQSFGSWVVLPEPVSPATTTTGCVRINSTMRSASRAIGSDSSSTIAGNDAARAARAAAEASTSRASAARRGSPAGTASRSSVDCRAHRRARSRDRTRAASASGGGVRTSCARKLEPRDIGPMWERKACRASRGLRPSSASARSFRPAAPGL